MPIGIRCLWLSKTLFSFERQSPQVTTYNMVAFALGRIGNHWPAGAGFLINYHERTALDSNSWPKKLVHAIVLIGWIDTDLKKRHSRTELVLATLVFNQT